MFLSHTEALIGGGSGLESDAKKGIKPKVLYAYECSHCQRFHLTSRPRNPLKKNRSKKPRWNIDGDKMAKVKIIEKALAL